MGQHMEYAGNITPKGTKQNKAITTCIYGWWRLYGYNVVCEKPIFSYNKGIDFSLTIMVVETSLRRFLQLNPN